MENNKWMGMVGHRGCIIPCSGKPILRTRPGAVRMGADRLPKWVQCSECGYAPHNEKLQKELVQKLYYYQKKNNKIFKYKMTTRDGYWWNGKKTLGWYVEEMGMGWKGVYIFNGDYTPTKRGELGLTRNQAMNKAVYRLKDKLKGE